MISNEIKRRYQAEEDAEELNYVGVRDRVEAAKQRVCNSDES